MGRPPLGKSLKQTQLLLADVAWPVAHSASE